MNIEQLHKHPLTRYARFLADWIAPLAFIAFLAGSCEHANAQTTAERKANLRAFIDSRTDAATLQVEDALVPLGYQKLPTPPPEPPPQVVTYGARFVTGQKDRFYKDEVGADGITRLVEVSIPLSAVTINPGENWQAKINAGTTGTVFRVKAGVHAGQSITPKNGQEFWGEQGAAVDGTGVSGSFPRGSASNVLLKNLVIRNYKNAGWEGGMVGGGARGYDNNAGLKSLRVEDCDISGANGFGIRVGKHVKRCSIHHNANGGVSAYWVTGSLFEDNTIYENARGNGIDWSRTAKWWNCKGFTIRHNHFHDNGNNDPWLDANNVDFVIHNNLIENQSRTAIYHEIGYRGAIHHNHIRRCCLVGGETNAIRIFNSQDTEVFENVIEDCGTYGIRVASNERTTPGEMALGDWITRNNWIHHNRVSRCTQLVSVINWGDNHDPFTANNRFDFNVYKTGGFGWRGSTRNWSYWQAIPQDANGTYAP